MDLSNPNNWQLVYLQNFTGEFFGILQLPIASFDTQPISQNVIRIKVSSLNTRPNWTFGGSISQVINAGGVNSSIANFSLVLGQDRVIFLEQFSPYFLRFSLPNYFTQATISIFGFTP